MARCLCATGGKVEPGETILQGAHRELLEVCGCRLDLTEQESAITADLQECGTLHFEFEGEPVLMEVHVYAATTWQGEPQECDEVTNIVSQSLVLREEEGKQKHFRLFILFIFLTIFFFLTIQMAPCWFALEDIPYAKMWPDDKYWLPMLLEGECISS